MRPIDTRSPPEASPDAPGPRRARPKRKGTRRTPRGSDDGEPGASAPGTARPASPRADLYDSVTARIIAELEAGRIPWVQPWSNTLAASAGGDAACTPGLPRNALTGRAYSGINILTLWSALADRGFASQGWLTFAQAIQAGGCVRKGEHGTAIVYADRFVPRDRDAARASVSSQTNAAATGTSDTCEPRTVAFLKRFTVFNVAQCEGLPADLVREPAPLAPYAAVPAAERLIAASGVDFRIGGTRAFYVPALDFVAVPPQAAFAEPINYYRTCLHELTHATGHRSRLARQLVTAFGTKDYAREELVAELGSAFLCAALGIVPTVRHADYIACWLDLLRDDNRAIFRAASAASKAADWLLARDGAAHAETGPAIAGRKDCAVEAARP